MFLNCLFNPQRNERLHDENLPFKTKRERREEEREGRRKRGEGKGT